MTLIEDMSAAMAELAAVTQRIDPDQVEVAYTMICAARHVMLYGCGRAGLSAHGAGRQGAGAADRSCCDHTGSDHGQ